MGEEGKERSGKEREEKRITEEERSGERWITNGCHEFLFFLSFFPLGNIVCLRTFAFELLCVCLCKVKHYFRATYPAQSPAALCDVC